ncbi:TPA: type I restriction endonuclease [Vibrio alginolyticus]
MENKSISEAQYEAQVRTAITHAFPWLPSEGITHQDCFSFKLGHSNVTVNGKPQKNARARLDILIKYKNTPLAIFELKRPDVRISNDDIEQGLSYARVHHPRPPLVVVSNSKDVRILETETGKPWRPTEKSETAVYSLLEEGSKLAKDDLKNAVSTLLGTSPQVWSQVVKQITSQNIDELSGDSEDALRQFVNEFLIPRELTSEALKKLDNGERLTIIEGEPLSGKSNVLREIVEVGTKQLNYGFLYINADTDISLFSTLSDALTNSLDWYISPNDARNWIMKLSKTTDKKLVLVIDNVSVDSDTIRKEIETLTSGQYGKGLHIIIAMDDTVADLLCHSRNRRAVSAIGNRANRLKLAPLNNKEFTTAKSYFASKRLMFSKGCELNDELRQPWILKTIAANIMTSEKYKQGNIAAAILPVVGLELLHFSRNLFDASQTPFCLYRELAKGILEDLQDTDRAYQLKLELLNTFIIRRETALEYVSQQDLTEMSSSGLIRAARSESGDNSYVIRLPELMASELSTLIASQLTQFKTNFHEAAAWLAKTASSLPLGCIIAADAICSLGRRGNLNLELIEALLKLEPLKQPIPSGTKLATYIKGLGVIDLNVIDEKRISIEKDGRQNIIDVEPSDIPATYDNISSYMILSYLAGQRMIIESKENTNDQRIDLMLLGEVASASAPLRKISSRLNRNSFKHHELDDGSFIPCPSNGIIEPITRSLMSFFINEDRYLVNEFIETSITTQNAALMSRVYTALAESLDSADNEYSAWAKNMLKTVKPALSACFSSEITGGL